MQGINRRRGFTLVEMSIVLVIIGLIIGAIAVGRDLVQATKIRMAIAQIEKYKTAVNTFKVKYNAIPGDMAGDQALAYGFQPTSRPDTAGEIHGNGILEDTTLGTYVDHLIFELPIFWQDLASAHLVDGDFTQATMVEWGAGSAQNLNRGTVGNYLPASPLGNGTYVVAYGVSASVKWVWVGASLYSIPIAGGNYFQLTGILGTDVDSELSTALTITPSQAKAIDTKVDDGVFDTGQVMSSDWHRTDPTPSEAILPFNIQVQVAYNPFYWPANQCASFGIGYRTDIYADVPSCQLSFRM